MTDRAQRRAFQERLDLPHATRCSNRTWVPSRGVDTGLFQDECELARVLLLSLALL